MPHLHSRMKRLLAKQRKDRVDSKDRCPKFYNMLPLPNLPTANSSVGAALGTSNSGASAASGMQYVQQGGTNTSIQQNAMFPGQQFNSIGQHSYQNPTPNQDGYAYQGQNLSGFAQASPQGGVCGGSPNYWCQGPSPQQAVLSNAVPSSYPNASQMYSPGNIQAMQQQQLPQQQRSDVPMEMAMAQLLYLQQQNPGLSMHLPSSHSTSLPRQAQNAITSSSQIDSFDPALTAQLLSQASFPWNPNSQVFGALPAPAPNQNGASYGTTWQGHVQSNDSS